MKYPGRIHCKYTNKTLKLPLPGISWNFYTQQRQKWDKTDNLRQNTQCFEHKFIPVLQVMEVIFRKSGAGE